MGAMPRSLVTIDLAAIRHNVRTLRGLLDGAELWAVVKADGYGHGAVDVGRAALEAGAHGALRHDRRRGARAAPRAAPRAHRRPRSDGRGEFADARAARLELCVSAAEIPRGFRFT